MPERRRFFAALVLPDPAATEVDGLRRGLGSDQLERLPPHITLLAPLNVRHDEFERVGAHIDLVAAKSAALELEIGPTATFAPRAPVIYLAVSGAQDDLSRLVTLQDELVAGPLAPPAERAEPAFVPHVTLLNNASAEQIAAAVSALSSYRRGVVFDSLTLFQQELGPEHSWSAISDYRLASPAVIGRGGRELSFSLENRLDPSTARFLQDEWAIWRREAGSFREEDFVVLVHDDAGPSQARRSLVGVAVGLVQEEQLELAQIVVSRNRRGEGIGGQLLSFLERFAIDKDCAGIELCARVDSEAGFFLARGFVVVAQLSRRSTPDEVILRRELFS